MSITTWHPTKARATTALRKEGYTEHLLTSASGDHGHGSREYYARPGAALNEHGWPFETANASKVGSRWAATVSPRA